MTTDRPMWLRPSQMFGPCAALLVCAGCASTSAPSPREFNRIVEAIRQDERDLRMSHPYGGALAGYLSDNSPIEIRISNRTAVAKYLADGAESQRAFVPIETVLERVSIDEWLVTSQTIYPPWWWDSPVSLLQNSPTRRHKRTNEACGGRRGSVGGEKTASRARNTPSLGRPVRLRASRRIESWMVQGVASAHRSKLSSWWALSASRPNSRWHITLVGPRTRTNRPPKLSFRLEFTRSALLRSAKRRRWAGSSWRGFGLRRGKDLLLALLATVDGGGVVGTVTDQARRATPMDQGLVRELRQLANGKSLERAREGGAIRDLPLGIPAAQATQRRGASQQVDERFGGGQVPNHFGDKGFGQRQTGRRFAADPYPSIRCDQEGQIDQFYNPHEFLLAIGK